MTSNVPLKLTVAAIELCGLRPHPMRASAA